MCFGFDGEGELQRSLARKGALRRNVLRGTAAGAVGIAALGSGMTPAVCRG